MAAEKPDIQAIFNDAIARESDEKRSQYLDEACGDNPQVRGRVEALLRAHSEAGGFFGGQPAATEIQPIAEKPGSQIGPYKLLQQIGEGGMGVVYMAEQHEPVRRKVALKIIKPGMDTRQVIARFEAEQQALSLMDHPNIARVIDAGATASGRPYFVMELVRGVSVTEYCDQRQLTPRERLELFLPVCQAVQHAHQKGIIHRDIKPSNILVAEYDQRPVPKVIDFGVAKAINQPLTEKTMFTGFGQVVGTLEYMSPEQAQVNQRDIDTRTDVYALGVLLYELLTGTPPFDRERLRSAAWDEMLRIIREEDPPKPSTRLTDSKDSLPSISAQRHTEPAKLTKLVRGELDWIVMKALEKDRARRYESASKFAEDVQHHLDDDPVVACPPSSSYRVRKFVRRNRASVMVTGGIAAALVMSGAFAIVAHNRHLQEREAQVALRQARLDKRDAEFRAEQAEQARQLAERRAEQSDAARLNAKIDRLIEGGLYNSSGPRPDFAQAVEDFTEAIQARPEAPELYLYRGSVLHELARDEEAMADLEDTLVRQPGDNPAAHWLMAEVAEELGQTDKAKRHRELVQEQSPESPEALLIQALALGRAEKGLELVNQAIEADPFNPNLVYHRGRIAASLAFRRQRREFYELAVRDLEKVLIVRPDDPQLLWDLCFCLQNGGEHLADPAEDPAERSKELLDMWLQRQPDDPNALWLLADYLCDRGDSNGSLAAARRGLEHDPHNVGLLFFCGIAHENLGQYDQAIEYLSQALRQSRTAYIHATRAGCYAKVSKEELARHDIAEAERLVPKEHRGALEWGHLIDAYVVLGDLSSALACCDDWIEMERESGLPHRIRGRVLQTNGQLEEAVKSYTRALDFDGNSSGTYFRRGSAYAELNQFEEAIRDFRKAVELTPKNAPSYTDLGAVLAGQGKLDEAIACYHKAIELDPKFAGAHNNLGNALKAQGQLDEAIACYRQAIELDPKCAAAHCNLGNALRDEGQLDAAIAVCRQAIELDPKCAAAHSNLGNALYDQGQPDEAMACYRRAIKLDPKFAMAHANLGNALYHQGKRDEAIACWRTAIALDPKLPAYSGLGLALLKKGDVSGGIATLQKGIDLCPNDVGLRINMSHVLIKDTPLRDFPRAREHAQRGTELAPENAGSWANLGEAQYGCGQFVEAVASLEKAQRLGRELPTGTRLILAMAYWHTGDRDKACEHYVEAAARLDERNPSDHFRLRDELETLIGAETLIKHQQDGESEPEENRDDESSNPGDK